MGDLCRADRMPVSTASRSDLWPAARYSILLAVDRLLLRHIWCHSIALLSASDPTYEEPWRAREGMNIQTTIDFRSSGIALLGPFANYLNPALGLISSRVARSFISAILHLRAR